MTDPTYSYAAYCRGCGNMIAACVDDKHAAKDVARWIKRGDRVERVTADEVRSNLNVCACAARKGEVR